MVKMSSSSSSALSCFQALWPSSTANNYIFAHCYDLLIVGRSGVGKTSILHHLSCHYDAREEIAHLQPYFRPANDGRRARAPTNVFFNLWDSSNLRISLIESTAEQLNLRRFDALVLVFDVHEHRHLRNSIERWLNLILANCRMDVKVLVLINKIDLLGSNEESQGIEAGEQFVRSMGFNVVRVSARSGHSLKLAITMLLTEIIFAHLAAGGGIDDAGRDKDDDENDDHGGGHWRMARQPKQIKNNKHAFEKVMHGGKRPPSVWRRLWRRLLRMSSANDGHRRQISSFEIVGRDF